MKSPVAILTMLLASQVPGAAAQQPSPCTYETCAMRLEMRFWNTALVRGASGEKVASLGIFGNNLDRLFQGSDSALAYATQFRRRTRSGAVLTLTGSAALLASGLLLRDDDDALPRLGAATASLVLVTFGTSEIRSGWNGLQRAIWWHNRDLVDK